MSNMKRLLYRILALALLAPTFLACYGALTVSQDQLPIVFGVWMFGAFPGDWRGRSIQGFAARLKAPVHGSVAVLNTNILLMKRCDLPLTSVEGSRIPVPRSDGS